jgi:hypothetical protein
VDIVNLYLLFHIPQKDANHRRDGGGSKLMEINNGVAKKLKNPRNFVGGGKKTPFIKTQKMAIGEKLGRPIYVGPKAGQPI